MKERRLREALTECRDLLADDFQGGFAGLSTEQIERIRKEALHVRQFGLEWLGTALENLADKLNARRHSFEEGVDKEWCGLLCKIMRYLEEGISLAGLDEAGTILCRKDWEE